jgi:signal recognition particle GTPase
VGRLSGGPNQNRDNTPPILFSFVGRQGSGKSTIGGKLADYIRCPHIEASDVVRDLCGDLDRKDMPKTNERSKSDPTWY